MTRRDKGWWLVFVAFWLAVLVFYSCLLKPVAAVPIPLGFFKARTTAAVDPFPGCSSNAQVALADWVSRVQGQGSDVTASGTQSNVCTFIDGLMTDGVWAKLLRINIYAGDGLNALKAPLKNTLGNATDTLNNFVGGDYSQSAGLTGNGTTKYISTGALMNDASFGDDDIHMAAYVRTSTNELSVVLGAKGPGASNDDLLVDYSGTSYVFCNDDSRFAFVADTVGTGMYIGSRALPNPLLRLYRNGAEVATDAGLASLSRSTNALVVHAYNDLGTIDNFNTRTIEMYSVGHGLSATEMTNYTARYSTLRTALGR